MVEDYWAAITPIEAQKALVDLTVSSYPHLSSKSEREKVHRDLYKKAYPVELTTNEQIDIKDYFNQMGQSQGWHKQRLP